MTEINNKLSDLGPLNAAFDERLINDYRSDPGLVSVEWRAFFDRCKFDGLAKAGVV